MKAAIVPSANSTWEVKETKTPEPGENQVLIKIHASGMCYTDVHQTHSELPGDFPRTLGHEPVGEIVAVGVIAIELTPNDLREIDAAASKITVQAARYPEKLEKMTGL
jgi:D-arabinose 1-dehydrogenase-like Zn-dependent alcohol dehydrogenase